MRSIALSIPLACLGALACGCASTTNYVEPDTAANAAEIRFFPGVTGIAADSFYDGYTSEECADKAGEGRLVTFNVATKDMRTSRVLAGARLFVLAVSHVEPPPGAEKVLTTSCRSMLSFVPEAGKIYEIRQDTGQRSCPVTVKDAATGAELASYEKLKARGACRDKK